MRIYLATIIHRVLITLSHIRQRSSTID